MRDFAERSETCPDCGGSGKYVGLLTVDTCRTCGGDGRIAERVLWEGEIYEAPIETGEVSFAHIPEEGRL